MLFILASFLLPVICLIIVALISRNTKYTNPKGIQPFEPTKVEKRATCCTRDAFKMRKVPADVDYIIVGSGISSLYCAGLLARLGMKVLVLEQHYVAGGCTHSFEDKGYEFDTGLHYVGRMEKYKALLDLVSTSDKKVEWAKMGSEEDGFCYDEIKLGSDAPFKFEAGEAKFIGNLAKEFPDEETSIQEYVALCKKVNKKADLYFFSTLFHPLVQSVVRKLLCGEYLKWASKTTWEVVTSFAQAPRLRALLCGQFGDYGLKPQDSSFLIQAGITAHYMDGGYYPVGGSQEISKAIIPTIEAAGGRVLVKAKVEEIIIENGRAVGVRVQGEDQPVLASKGVISSAGAVLTEALVPAEHRDQLGYKQMITDVPPSISHVYAFIGLKGTPQELGLRAANLWVLPVDQDYRYEGVALDNSDRDEKDPYTGIGDDDEKDDMLLFMGFPAMKDPSFAERFPGKSTCELISTSHTEYFERLLPEGASESTQSGKRGAGAEGYDALKKRLEGKLLRGLYRHYPKCKGQVEYVEVATPVTNKYYLGRADSYGLEHTPARYSGALGGMRPATTIPGLYCTGQDVATVGIVGALNAGILTAHALVGYGFWDLVVCDRNLIEDLMAYDNAANGAKAKTS